MIQKIVKLAFIFLCFGAVSALIAQTPEGGIKPSVVTGEVAAISDNKIVVKSKDGTVDAILSVKTEYKRVLPENPSLKAATASTFAEIGVGDKVVVTGVLSDDKKSLPARTVYLMTKSDISQKHAKEVAEWKTRGIAGKVTSVNTATNQISVEIRSLMGSSTLVLTPKEKATFRRYAPDSIRFDETLTSSLSEVKQGDMLRALGDKSSDGTSFAAEEVVTGAFQTIAGTVKSIDIEKNEVVITDLQTKKDLTIVLSGTSVLKRFPAEQAERMAGIQLAGAGNGPRPPAGQGRTQSAQGSPAAGQGQTPGGGRPGFGIRPVGGADGGGIDEMLERFPNITAADLKAGDMIAISSTKNGTTDRIKAIKLLAGVEPFLRLAQASGRQGQRGQGADFNIPGLDGISFP